jgi:hypothetical protein
VPSPSTEKAATVWFAVELTEQVSMAEPIDLNAPCKS